ncbi:hypothetical protein ICL81_05955 [Leucobacter sp. cx-328]|uniref:hypothetical protein n=1 Tax=unclassified Leucobacter TaxID=2621730 RepID=UPI00165E9DC1|nr:MULTISPECIES: hypothetical protein [unclassified Leucobacter]MBC9944059.1 hypothetical protein [Leucobacter sp. cx-328]
MTSVTQRIAQYNKEVGQRRCGLVNPKLLTVTQFDDGLGSLDHRVENQHAGAIGMVVNYLSRLADIRLGPDDSPLQLASEAVCGSLFGTRRPRDSGTHASTKEEAAHAALNLNILEHEDGSETFVMDDDAVRIACELAVCDPAIHLGSDCSTLRAPDETTTSHTLTMVERSQHFFEDYGPGLDVGFFFVDEDDEEMRADGGRGGYNIFFGDGDGEFLIEDTLWSFDASASRPNKDHLLQLLVHHLMGKQSGLPQFTTQTHIGVFNPRLNTMYRLTVDEIPDDVIEIVRRDIMGNALW